jgi:outer membrane receptor for ferrienterochelin and colicin
MLFFILQAGGWAAFSQSFTINGYVEDSRSGEKLIGANVYDKRTYKGTTTNSYGFFSLTLSKDSVELVISFVGYQQQSLPIYLDENITINFEVSPAIELKEVEIVSSQSEKIQEQSQMSSIVIPMEQIKNLPVFFGEKDVLKIIQLLPGVKSGGEGSSGIYVRGGGPDQNLILLDGVPVYNVSHLFGFFSVFNPDAINSVQLIKGGFPARYGGRLSSVIDIRMKEGNTKKFHGEGAIGLVASKLTLEGPIYKDKTSFIVSGRRTYIDLLARPLIKAATRQAGAGDLTAGYYFYDMNAKINHKFSDNSRLFLSAYLGNDKFYFKNKNEYLYDNVKYINKENAGIKWGNITTSLRWNYILTKKMFSNTTLTYSRYRFLTEFGNETISQSSTGTATEKCN